MNKTHNLNISITRSGATGVATTINILNQPKKKTTTRERGGGPNQNLLKKEQT